MSGEKKKSNLLLWVVIVLGGGFACLACAGILAAIAIPSFVSYLSAAKTAEARSQLGNLYLTAAAYYATEHVGPNGELLSGCVVDSAITPEPPSSYKTMLSDLPESFEVLGFLPMEPVYYQYEIVSAGGGCGHGAGESLYTFRAHGDLDGDGVQSLYELTAESVSGTELVRAATIRETDPLE